MFGLKIITENGKEIVVDESLCAEDYYDNENNYQTIYGKKSQYYKEYNSYVNWED